jgi:enoyl-CoA hydratase
MDYKTLLWERFDAVLRITANRPHVLNAQSRVLLMELDEALRRASDDADVKVIIIAGAGKHFSAGHDLGSPEEMEDQKRHPVQPGFEGEYRRLSQLFLDTCLRWRDVPKPTIAQVQGYCIMGGLMLASCCDLIVAADDALFADRAVAGAARMCSISRCPGTSARARPRSTSSPASSSPPPRPRRWAWSTR